ncbi:hypothetical protein [Streptomyces sp. NPDC047097]|uniref:hypothetical protein n=1 Tax=Streptomyces sp. NPDC047097 TaxID=3155260 RepID=UPI0033C54BB6
MTDPTTPVDGPFAITVTPVPAGVALDVTPFLTAILLTLAAAVAEDPDGMLDDLREIADLARSATHQGADSHARHELDERMQRLLAEVADDGCMPVYGQQVHRLADSLLRTAGPRAVEAGAA